MTPKPRTPPLTLPVKVYLKDQYNPLINHQEAYSTPLRSP